MITIDVTRPIGAVDYRQLTVSFADEGLSAQLVTDVSSRSAVEKQTYVLLAAAEELCLNDETGQDVKEHISKALAILDQRFFL